MTDRKRKDTGFTLLELLMVVIIVGILASLAIPQYLKTVERARMAEAVGILGQLRSSEVRYKAFNATYTKNLLELDFDPTDVAGPTNPAFTYTGESADATSFDIKATRTNTPPIGGNCKAPYTLHINEIGNIAGTDCQQQS